MRNPGASVLLFVLLWLSLSQSPAYSALLGPESDDEFDFNYIEGSGKGPEDWWRRKESWRICKHGKLQSPIKLTGENAFPSPSMGPLQALYKLDHAVLKNRVHDIMLEWPDGGGSLYIHGTRYKLEQCHWHSPAEHTIDGTRPDLEMHVVHQRDGKVAVVAILYNISSTPDPFLSKLTKPLQFLAERKKKRVSVGIVTPLEVGGSGLYYRYMGSLTTPPCKEGVVWTVLEEVRSVAKEQVQLLRDAVHDGMKNNARPLQPTNGRWIGRFPPQVQDEHPSS